MLCLCSFHGDPGVPWWLIDTQGAIHLYTGCVRGRAAGTSAPTTNPTCKCKENTCAVQFRAHWLKSALGLHAISPGWFFSSLCSVLLCLSVCFISAKTRIVLSDTKIAFYSAASVQMCSHSNFQCSCCCDMMSIKFTLIVQRWDNLFSCAWDRGAEERRLALCFMCEREEEWRLCLSHGPASRRPIRGSLEHQQQNRDTAL